MHNALLAKAAHRNMHMRRTPIVVARPDSLEVDSAPARRGLPSSQPRRVGRAVVADGVGVPGIDARAVHGHAGGDIDDLQCEPQTDAVLATADILALQLALVPERPVDILRRQDAAGGHGLGVVVPLESKEILRVGRLEGFAMVDLGPLDEGVMIRVVGWMGLVMRQGIGKIHTARFDCGVAGLAQARECLQALGSNALIDLLHLRGLEAVGECFGATRDAQMVLHHVFWREVKVT